MDRILRTNHANHLVCEKTKSVSWNSCGLQFVSSLYQQTLFARREAIVWGLLVLLAALFVCGNQRCSHAIQTDAPASQSRPFDDNDATADLKEERNKKSKADSAKPSSIKAEKEPKIAHIRLDGSFSEGTGQGGLLAVSSPSLQKICERLDKAASDDGVGGVLLLIESIDVGRARVDEIRRSIEKIKKAGKPVVAYLVGGESIQFMLAGACDAIVMPPAAPLAVTGVRAEMTFYKDLLDKVGVDAEILQVGQFKGAAEPLTRSSMSPQLRAQYELFVEDLFDQLVDMVAADRNLDRQQVIDLIDVGVLTPDAAVEAKLIDMVGYEDEAISNLASRMKNKNPKVIENYFEQKIDAHFSGLGGLVKLVELFSGEPEKKSRSRNKSVAIVHLVGEITDGSSEGSFLSGGGPSTRGLIEALREASKDEKIVAIVMRIDSPGGSALASDLIWREIKRIEKPVVASLSDTAASGGYYVAVATDLILAAPGTLTGSIGVVGGKIALGGAMERVGVKTDVVSRGKNSGWLSTQTPFNASERKVFMATMEDVYRLFTTKVAEGRKMDLERVKSLAEGRVFTGRMAQKIGLVDRLGTLEDAIVEAKLLAGLKADESVERVILPEPRNLFDDLFGSSEKHGDSIAGLSRGSLDRNSLAMIRACAQGMSLPGLELIVHHARALLEITSGRPLAMMPMHVEIR